MQNPVAKVAFITHGNAPILHGNNELICNGMDEKSRKLEHVLPTSHGETNSSSQFMFPHKDATHFPNCGIMGMDSPFLSNHTYRENEHRYGLSGMEPLMQAAPLKNDILDNTCTDQLLPSSRQFEPSQGHMKRFLMFDHSAGQGRIFLPPAFLEELNGNIPSESAYGNASHGVFCPMDISMNSMMKCLDPVFGSELDARLVGLQKTVNFAFAAPQLMTNSRVSNMANVQEDGDPGTYSVSEGQNSSRISCAGGNEPRCGTNSSYWHENTDDIDALLYSDDEVTSTGHFPEDGSFYEGTECDSQKKKRKREDSNCTDGVSITSSQVDSTKESLLAAECPGSTVLHDTDDDSPVSKRLSTMELAPKVVSGDSQNMIKMSKVRRQKIRRTIRTLRKIIPGGNCMDAAVVIDEAIQYLRSLQCKVQQLDKTKSQKAYNGLTLKQTDFITDLR